MKWQMHTKHMQRREDKKKQKYYFSAWPQLLSAAAQVEAVPFPPLRMSFLIEEYLANQTAMVCTYICVHGYYTSWFKMTVRISSKAFLVMLTNVDQEKVIEQWRNVSEGWCIPKTLTSNLSHLLVPFFVFQSTECNESFAYKCLQITRKFRSNRLTSNL